MAANVNAQAIKVSNERVRVLADLLMQVYNFAKVTGDLSIAQGWTANLFATDADTISDGSGVAGDGRPQITNGQAKIVLAHAATLVTDFEASSSLKKNQLLVASVNPTR